MMVLGNAQSLHSLLASLRHANIDAGVNHPAPRIDRQQYYLAEAMLDPNFHPARNAGLVSPSELETHRIRDRIRLGVGRL
jgi:hypothetical protein